MAIFFLVLKGTFSFAQSNIIDPIFSLEIGRGTSSYGALKYDKNSLSPNLSAIDAKKISGTSFYLRGEYYISKTNFSLKGGYEKENLLYNGVNSGEALEQIMLGTRYYPLKNKFILEPYVGLDGFINVGTRNMHVTKQIDLYANLPYYTDQVHFKTPRFSVAPAIGFECKVFSCIALNVEYGYRWGIDSKAKVNQAYNHTQATAFLSQSLNRHHLNIGAKITFPFSFDWNENFNLVDVLMSLFFND